MLRRQAEGIGLAMVCAAKGYPLSSLWPIAFDRKAEVDAFPWSQSCSYS